MAEWDGSAAAAFPRIRPGRSQRCVLLPVRRKNIVANGLAQRCEVQVAYAIGKRAGLSVRGYFRHRCEE
ncbi:MAG: methionine adenosyltransferase domain-containing protein [Merdibacter sp.]